jgi:hydrogenase expression/formation protein HypE
MEIIYPAFKTDLYSELSDATGFPRIDRPMFTTDTYVIDPPVFPGGDIGKLAVFGTCNDLAVAGAKPLYLSLGLVLEEGFSLATLKEILYSAAEAAREAGVRILTGDTKVVPQGKGGGIFINTSGVGDRITDSPLTGGNIEGGDEIIVSGPVGSHGIAILTAREGLDVGAGIRSDCASLFPMCEELTSLGQNLKFMRDATRGGVAAILNEIVSGTDIGIDVSENGFPVLDPVRSVSEILGLNPLEIANEGVFAAIVASGCGEEAVSMLRGFEEGKHASLVGKAAEDHPGKVIMETVIGGRRILDFPRGLLLPRIC